MEFLLEIVFRFYPSRSGRGQLVAVSVGERSVLNCAAVWGDEQERCS